jgi:phenylalanine-4-hydroxylase
MQVPTTSDHALRGDYSAVGPDMTIAQDWGAYTPAEHGLWRWLHDRQAGLMRRYAAGTVTRALARLDYATAIPDLEKVSASLRRATGWRLVAVPGLIPDDVFFSHLASRQFPVTTWLRKAEEVDYLVEPDIFHDFYGHVPLLFDPVFADFLQLYGLKGGEARRLGTTDLLARVYWYTVEFGLVREAGEFRAFGAGILSSFAETQFSIDDPAPNRVGFVLERVLRTEYRIDDFQQTYFVLEDFDQLFRAIQRDFRPLYADTRAIPRIGPFELAEDDILLWRGRGRRHPTGSIQDNVTGIGPGHR